MVLKLTILWDAAPTGGDLARLNHSAGPVGSFSKIRKYSVYYYSTFEHIKSHKVLEKQSAHQ